MKRIISLISIFALIAAGAIGYWFFSGDQRGPDIGAPVGSSADVPAADNEDTGSRIIAAGDSLTAGYDLPLSDSYPKILEAKLRRIGENVEVINTGISGETTAGLLERAQFIADQEPDILLITIGGNDAFRNLPLKNTKENITKALQIFKQSVKAENIYLLQIEATANSGLAYRNGFNGMYEDIASSEKVNLLPFVVREVFLDPDKMLPDGIHPNKIGYEYIVDEYIFPAVSKKLGR